MNIQDKKGNTVFHDGMTPLHYACQTNNSGMVLALMKAGAQIPGDESVQQYFSKKILGKKPSATVEQWTSKHRSKRYGGVPHPPQEQVHCLYSVSRPAPQPMQ